jgi:glycosyltransferase involved in cell wall biosynthesis
MLRLHCGLQAIGAESRLLVREGETGPDCDRFDPVLPESARLNEQLFGYFLQHKGIESNRSALSNTAFTLPFPGFDLSGHPAVGAADIINLHWPSYVLSPVTQRRLLELGKPVFWTLHDQWAFTGGCHYASGCVGYEKNCSACPQTEGVFSELPAAILRERKRQLTGHALNMVGPSKWIVDSARRSSLLRDQPIHQVPYGIETNVFRPMNAAQARKRFGLPANAFVLLFGADHLVEKRKGWHHLNAALELVVEKLGGRRPIHLAFFGNPPDDLTALPVPLHELGYIRDDQKLKEAYNAADLFLLPSLEDNQPNTVMEAMACGTPVAGFQVGALTEMITDLESGYLAPTGDARALGEAIIRCANTPAAQPAIRAAARRVIETRYPLKLQAERYAELYRSALASEKPAKQKPARSSIHCPLSADVGRLLDDRDVLKPLGQVIKAETEDADPFDPGWSFGKRKEKRRVQHYLKAWIGSLPPGRRYYLTDEHGIYCHNTISLRSGFRVPEGPYPEMHLPWPLVWSEFPEAEFALLKSTARSACLRIILQTPIDGLQMALYGPSGCLANEVLRKNLSNPERSRSEFEIDLPQLEAGSTLRLIYNLPSGVEAHENLAIAIFGLGFKQH